MNMSESVQIIFAICLLIAVYMLTRKVNAWRIKRAYVRIIKDLEKKEALTPSSAVSLPYARQSIFRLGVRDFRPRALQFLIASHIVGVTEDGAYYLKDKGVGILKNDQPS